MSTAIACDAWRLVEDGTRARLGLVFQGDLMAEAELDAPSLALLRQAAADARQSLLANPSRIGSTDIVAGAAVTRTVNGVTETGMLVADSSRLDFALVVAGVLMTSFRSVDELAKFLRQNGWTKP